MNNQMSSNSEAAESLQLGKTVVDYITASHGKSIAHAWFEPAVGDDYNIVCAWKRMLDGSVRLRTGSSFRAYEIKQRFGDILERALGCRVIVER